MFLFKHTFDEIISYEPLDPIMHKEMNDNSDQNIKRSYHKETPKWFSKDITQP
jgi:hypothetical protein